MYIQFGVCRARIGFSAIAVPLLQKNKQEFIGSTFSIYGRRKTRCARCLVRNCNSP